MCAAAGAAAGGAEYILVQPRDAPAVPGIDAAALIGREERLHLRFKLAPLGQEPLIFSGVFCVAEVDKALPGVYRVALGDVHSGHRARVADDVYLSSAVVGQDDERCVIIYRVLNVRAAFSVNLRHCTVYGGVEYRGYGVRPAALERRVKLLHECVKLRYRLQHRAAVDRREQVPGLNIVALADLPAPELHRPRKGDALRAAVAYCTAAGEHRVYRAVFRLCGQQLLHYLDGACVSLAVRQQRYQQRRGEHDCQRRNERFLLSDFPEHCLNLRNAARRWASSSRPCSPGTARSRRR